VITATVSVAVNLVLGLVLMGPLKHGGLALATSLASMVNLSLMVYVLRKKLGGIRWRPIFAGCLKTLVASTVMALVVLLIRHLPVFEQAAPGGMRLLIMIGTAIGGGVAVFSATAWWLNIPEWHQVMGLVKRSLGRA
jgi:putative peptidoglycan lipid II flippase